MVLSVCHANLLSAIPRFSLRLAYAPFLLSDWDWSSAAMGAPHSFNPTMDVVTRRMGSPRSRLQPYGMAFGP